MTVHPATKEDESLKAECQLRFQRRSGPGGQHRNKVETGVFLRHISSGVTAEATERRSQAQNLKLALHRLRLNLAIELRSNDRPAGPSSVWTSRCRGGRISVQSAHEQFPRLLAEALDVLDAVDWDAKRAAVALGCSTTQLVRFLKLEPRAIHQLNDRRKAIGLRPLR